MTKTKTIIIFSTVFFGVFGLAKSSQALDITAANLELATVQAAIDQVNAAGGGGTVYLPAGTSPILTSSLYVPGGVNIIGAGNPMTTQDPNTHKWGPEPTTVLRINSYGFISVNASGHSWVRSPIRIANIKFVAAGTYPSNFIQFRDIPGGRIDHCIFDGTGVTASDGRGKMYQVGMGSIWSEPIVATTGVIDHCNFIWTGYAVHVGPRIWIDDKPLGMADDIIVNGVHIQNAVVVEDCYIENSNHPIAGMNGAHWVLRHTYITGIAGTGNQGYMVDAHGPCFEMLGGGYEGQCRGTNVTESYNNYLDHDIAFSYLNWGAFRLRSGKGVIFTNTIRNQSHAAIFTVDQGTCTYNGLDAPHDFYIWDNTLINVVPPQGQQGDCANGFYWNDHAYCSDTYIYCGSPHGIMVDTPMPSYTPYTYPHPLTLGSAPTPDTTPPAAPSGVTVQ